MKKITKCMTDLVLVPKLLSAMCITAFAQGNVTYEGNAKEFVFAPGSEYSPTDLFTDFKGVMPGDSITQQVVIKNTADKKVTVRIYMRALGAQEGSEEFLSRMNLTVSGNREIFNAPADQTAQLTDWVYLGEFSSGAEAAMDVTLHVPITMDDDFQESIGYLDWQFKAEEIPVPTPVVPTPETGDTMNMGLWIGLAAVCALGVVFVVVAKNRMNKKED